MQKPDALNFMLLSSVSVLNISVIVTGCKCLSQSRTDQSCANPILADLTDRDMLFIELAYSPANRTEGHLRAFTKHAHYIT